MPHEQARSLCSGASPNRFPKYMYSFITLCFYVPHAEYLTHYVQMASICMAAGLPAMIWVKATGRHDLRKKGTMLSQTPTISFYIALVHTNVTS